VTSLPSNLPDIRSASLPESYERAKTALTECNRIDECKDWADKAAALASYAKQSEDKTLFELAVRIQSRAIRRCGELLETYNKGVGAPPKNGIGGDTIPTQREAAEQAGLSKRQEVTAARVAKIPDDQFEALVESSPPPTVTTLADFGTVKTGQRTVPLKFGEATHVLGVLREFVGFCAEQPAADIAAAVLPHEVSRVRDHVNLASAWLQDFQNHLQEGANAHPIHRSGTEG